MKKKIQNIKKADLQNFARMCELREEAITLKRINRNYQDTLRFFAIAMHALAVGHNPPANFVSNIFHQRWSIVSLVDEDRAREFIRTKRCPEITRTPTTRKRGTQ